MAQQFRLVRYAPKSFAGIHEGMNLVVMIPEDSHVIGFSGDQGVGKTSNLKCLEYLLGGERVANAVNSVDDGVSATLEMLTSEGQKLTATCNKSNFNLYLEQELNGKPVKAPVQRPREFLRSVIGNVGTTPMFLKDMKGAEQIKWLRSLVPFTDEQLREEANAVQARKDTFKLRTDFNRDKKRLHTEVVSTGLYQYDKTNETFIPTEKYKADTLALSQAGTDTEAIQEEFTLAGKAVANLNAWTADLEKLKNEKAGTDREVDNINEQIVVLRQQIVALEQKKEGRIEAVRVLEERIEKGKVTLDGMKDAPQKLEEARVKMQVVYENQARHQAITLADQKRAQYETAWNKSNELSAKIADYDVWLRQFVQAFTPDIEGLEVRVSRVIDVEFEAEAYRTLNPEASDKEVKEHVLQLETHNEDGLFYHERSVAMLSESELWDLCLLLWKFMGTRVILIDNVSSLGSEAVERINWMAEQGLYVFYSKMERGAKDLEIIFNNKEQPLK